MHSSLAEIRNKRFVQFLAYSPACPVLPYINGRFGRIAVSTSVLPIARVGIADDLAEVFPNIPRSIGHRFCDATSHFEFWYGFFFKRDARVEDVIIINAADGCGVGYGCWPYHSLPM